MFNRTEFHGELIDLYYELYDSKSLDKLRKHRHMILNGILNQEIFKSKKSAL